MKKKKAGEEMCVWVKDKTYKGAYRPRCADGWRLYIVSTKCACGKEEGK